MTTVDVEHEVVSAFVLKSMRPFPKNQNCSFITRIALLFSRTVLLSLRNVYLFNVFVFQEWLLSKVIVRSIFPAQSSSKRFTWLNLNSGFC